MTAHVELTIDHHVATLSLHNPGKKNAMSPELGTSFMGAVERLKGQRDARVAIVTGAEHVFSAGGDFAMLERMPALSVEASRDFMLGFYRSFLCVTALEIPTIAAVEGVAIGAGLCLALACDLMVVGDDAKLAVNFAKLGLGVGLGATYLVPRRFGAQRGAELLFTGRTLDGHEAALLGGAVASVPGPAVIDRAHELAERIAGNAPLVVRALKRRLGVDQQALEATLLAEAQAQAESYKTADLQEGLQAAKARRPPQFKGA